MKAIKIAPSTDEIEVTENSISTKFSGGITYTTNGLSNFKDEYLKEVFSAAIAMSSKRWKIEYILDKTLNLKGSVK